MKKTVDISKEINDMRKLPANKKCFECGEIGTTYIVPDFGVFVCSICAGIHREFNHRVKGLSMSNFTQQELDLLKTQGNDVCQRTWLARYNPRDFPQPSPKETQRIKDFIRLKYRERRWFQDQPQQATPPPAQVETREPASQPVAMPRPAAPPQQSSQVSDLLSLGEPQARPPAATSSEGWADFAPATNQVNIQISFQQPKTEDRKQTEMTQAGNPMQVQVRQMPPNTYQEPQPEQVAQKETYHSAPVQAPMQPSFQSAGLAYPQAPASGGFQQPPVPDKRPIAPTSGGAPPQPGPAYPPQPGPAYPQQPGPAYPPQPGPVYNPQPGAAYPSQPGAAYPPQPAAAYPPQPGAYPPQPAAPYGYPGQPPYPPQQPQGPYPIYQQPMTGDPFSRLVDADMEKQAQKHGGSGGINIRLLQQQYHVQSQTYTQMYGVPYPYTFQAWCQLMFPKPAGGLAQSRGNNPFDMFG